MGPNDDVKDTAQMDEALRVIAEGVSSTGETFFRSLAEYLARTLDAAHVIIGELVEDKADTVRTLAAILNSKVVDNFEYPLANTPCQNVINQKLRCYPSDLQGHFPENPTLVSIGANSFIGMPLFDSENRVIGIITVMDTKSMERTEMAESVLKIFGRRASAELQRKQAERALLESEEKYRDLFENAMDAIFVVDLRMNYVDMNRRATEIFGYSKEEFLGMNIRDVIPLEQLARSEAEFGKLEEQGGYQNFIGKMRTKDGRWLDVEVNSSAIIRDGTVVGSRDIVRNITKRKSAEDRLRDAEMKYHALFEQSPDGILIIDEAGGLVEFNEAAHLQRGYSREEFSRLSIADIDVSHLPEEIDRSIRTVLEKGSAEFEVKHRTKDGAIRDVLVIARRMELSGRTVFHTIWRDITDRKRMEENLVKTEKLESLGVLAGGIAHDFNNLLIGIVGNISLAKLHTREQSLLSERLAEAEKACFLAKGLTQQLLTFAKSGQPLKKTISIDRVLRDSCSLSLSGSAARCRFSITPDLLKVEADEAQISQVISNLIINADQAMPYGGLIEVACENVQVEPDSGLPLAPGLYVKISLTDEGVGIPDEFITKIFDPYFTTKKKGSGLGLATAYSIVKNHGGHIDVESEVKAGTTFRIYLPASAETVLEEGGARHVIEGRGRVLVMDDEEIVRYVTTNMLRQLGYDVKTAENGEEAIALYRQGLEDGRPFSAVILDLTVRGGMGGKETLGRLRALDPSVRAVVFSGYPDAAVVARYPTYGFKGYLSKPCDLQELSEVMHKVLADEGGT
jgi:two-component system cell cycle sensor histidine kinase/response regulator CckA